MAWTLRHWGAHALQVLQIISIPDKIKRRAVSFCFSEPVERSKKTQKSSGEAETACTIIGEYNS